MARISRLQIQNFRSIQSLNWTPVPGFNCLIGPGESEKSSILDAIDLWLGARRNPPCWHSVSHRSSALAP
nr:AAA family ATPase [Pseudomonas syringae]